MPVFDPFRFSSLSLDMLASGRSSAQAIDARQQSRLRMLVAAAQQESPFYREHLRGCVPGLTPLHELPSVSRQALMDRFDDWVTDPQLKLSEVLAFVADPLRIGQAFLGKYLVWESSGTHHVPGVFVQDAQTLAVYDALEVVRRSVPRPLQRCLDPLALTERVAFVGVTSGHFASAVCMQRARALNPWQAPFLQSFSILQSNRLLVDALNAFAPTVIATYPTVAAMLADEAERGALGFAPKEMWTGGETLSATVRQRLEQVFGCAVRNSYGASEFMSIAWECARGQLHANTDWVILEPVDDRGQPMPANERSYSTLLTNLANHVQPLIRYDLGDQLTMRAERCDCGCRLPVIEVLGRRDDALLMAGRTGQAVTLLPMALTTVLEDEAGVFDFHLRQLDDHTLALWLPLQGAEGEKALARCRLELNKFALAQELQPIRVMGELGQTMPRGRSGKAQRVVAKSQGSDFS